MLAREGIVGYVQCDNNMGDLLGPYIFEKITGVKAGASAKYDQIGKLRLCGSLVNTCVKDIHWGTGIMDSKSHVSDHIFLAVRGPATLHRLLMNGNINIKDFHNMPIGDPGLLVPKFYSPKNIKKKYKLGIIPHFVDKKLFTGKPAIPGVKIINIQQKPESFVNELIECESTISSSLHGVILSVAYGIPTRWTKLGNRLQGDDIKFFDFFMSLYDRDNMCDYLSLVLSERNGLISKKMLSTSKYWNNIKYWYPMTLDVESLFSGKILPINITRKTHQFKITTNLTSLMNSFPFSGNTWKSKSLNKISDNKEITNFLTPTLKNYLSPNTTDINYLKQIIKGDINKISFECCLSLIFAYMMARVKLSHNNLNTIYNVMVTSKDQRINEYISLIKFLTNKDIKDRKFLPLNETKATWKSYLKVLDFKTINELPLEYIKLSEKSWIPKNPEKMDRVVVTFMYDVEQILYHRKLTDAFKSNMDYYLNASVKLLDTNSCMYIVVNPEIYDFVYNYRKQKGLLNKTVILSVDIRNSPYYYYKPLVSQCFNENRIGSVLRKQNDYILRGLFIIWWTKMKVIEKSIIDNYFGSDIFIWVDFGLMKKSMKLRTPTLLRESLEACPDDKIKIIGFDTFSKAILANRESFYRRTRYTTCAGMISFPKHLYGDYMKLWNQELEENLKLGYPSSEEQILSSVYQRNKNLFEFHIGDYQDLLLSWTSLSTRFDILLKYLRSRRSNKDWKNIVSEGEKFLRYLNSIKKYNFSSSQDYSIKTLSGNHYSIENLLIIYDEFFIGFWYSGKRNLSTEIAIKMSELIPFSNISQEQLTHYKTNMGYHGINPMKKHIKCVFPHDNNVVIYLPFNNKSISKYSECFPVRYNVEKIFRRICTYLINKGLIKRNIIDSGAWIGDNSLPWARNLDSTIYAIDPSKINCNYIDTVAKVSNIENIKILNKALSNKEETLSTDEHIEHCEFKVGSSGNFQTTSTTIDHLYNDKIIDDLDFIHLDVEGMEWKVIQGSLTVIDKFSPIVAFECHLNTDDYMIIVDFFKSKGYRVFMITSIMTSHRSDCRNFIAFPPGKNNGLIVEKLTKHLLSVDEFDSIGGEFNVLIGHGTITSYIWGGIPYVKGRKLIGYNDTISVEYNKGKFTSYFNGQKLAEYEMKKVPKHEIRAIVTIYEEGASVKNVIINPSGPSATKSSIDDWDLYGITLVNDVMTRTKEGKGYNSRAISKNATSKITVKPTAKNTHVRIGLGRLNTFGHLLEF